MSRMLSNLTQNTHTHTALGSSQREGQQDNIFGKGDEWEPTFLNSCLTSLTTNLWRILTFSLDAFSYLWVSAHCCTWGQPVISCQQQWLTAATHISVIMWRMLRSLTWNTKFSQQSTLAANLEILEFMLSGLMQISAELVPGHKHAQWTCICFFRRVQSGALTTGA